MARKKEKEAEELDEIKSHGKITAEWDNDNEVTITLTVVGSVAFEGHEFIIDESVTVTGYRSRIND